MCKTLFVKTIDGQITLFDPRFVIDNQPAVMLVAVEPDDWTLIQETLSIMRSQLLGEKLFPSERISSIAVGGHLLCNASSDLRLVVDPSALSGEPPNVDKVIEFLGYEGDEGVDREVDTDFIGRVVNDPLVTLFPNIGEDELSDTNQKGCSTSIPFDIIKFL